MKKTRRTIAIAAILGIVLAIAHHGHHCTGDDCAICLVVHLVQALVCASASIAVIQPSLSLVALVACVILGFLFNEHTSPHRASDTHLTAITPVTNRVKLLI